MSVQHAYGPHVMRHASRACSRGDTSSTYALHTSRRSRPGWRCGALCTPARVPFPRKQNKVIKCDALILGMHECSRRCFCDITRLIYYNLFFSHRIDRASHQPPVATFLSSVHYREIFIGQKSTNTCCSRCSSRET
jgi:hypothetical protein